MLNAYVSVYIRTHVHPMTACLCACAQIGDTVVPKKSFQGAVCVGGGCMLFLFAGNVVMTLLFLCSIVVALHAALHKGVSYDAIAQKNGVPHPDLGV